MKEFMKKLRTKVVVGLVGGSDFHKIQEQMGGDDGKVNSESIAVMIDIWWRIYINELLCRLTKNL